MKIEYSEIKKEGYTDYVAISHSGGKLKASVRRRTPRELNGVTKDEIFKDLEKDIRKQL